MVIPATLQCESGGAGPATARSCGSAALDALKPLVKHDR